MGFRFLRHIARTSTILYAVDLSDSTPPEDVLSLLTGELSSFDAGLVDRPAVLVGTKMDLVDNRDSFRRLTDAKESAAAAKVFATSAATGEGIEELAVGLLEGEDE